MALLNALEQALDHGLNTSDVRMGLEHAIEQWDDRRAVVQFGVGSDIFDWFFNARTGYRAHFRVHYMHGLEFNSLIIDTVRDRLARLPYFVHGRELDSEFKDYGAASIPRSFLLTSFVPDLSKIWYCSERIRRYGGIKCLPIGVGGPRLLLEGDVCWAALYRADDSAWLEVKGAFLGKAGPYQPKDPVDRAKQLQATGEA